MTPYPTPHLRDAVTSIEKQQILAVSELALGDKSVIPLWYGESDVPTARFICEAAAEAMYAGETFYSHKRGTPELIGALSAYLGDLYGRPVARERISVTSSGMTAIMLCLQCIVDAGDNVIVVNPVWPNAQSAVRVLGGEVRYVTLDATEGRWSLDMDRLVDAMDGRTRAVFVNSPNNPTGWVMPGEQQREMLQHCRKRGIWIVSDEVYARMVYEGRSAPSFLEIAEPDDPVLVINSFSKSWAMTGWRIGWIVHPARIGDLLGNMIEFNYSCVPPFLQRAATVAITEGEPVVEEIVDYCRRGRDVISQRLPSMPRIEGFAPPEASFYAFFRIAGVEDSLAFAQDLVRRAKLGVAPGTAFGPGAERWFRLCFAQTPQRLAEAMDRLERGLAA